jgi:hypothetical protein
VTYDAAAVWTDFGTIALETTNYSIKSKLNIYPNPTTSQITFSQEISSIEIFDVIGKKVKTFENTTNTFNVSSLEKGIYLVKGKTTEGIEFSEKFIKK